jgi:hypothetical protein
VVLKPTNRLGRKEPNTAFADKDKELRHTSIPDMGTSFGDQSV